MEKILTVVIPSYNVEKYLDQTLQSFIDVSIMEKLEVLVVDDGSKDRTAEIGEKYVLRYPETFRVIRKKNGGHGSTINVGITEANGKYFKVVDGDDWVETKDFAELVLKLENCDSDFVMTNFKEVDDQTRDSVLWDYKKMPDGKEMSFAEAAEKNIMPMHALTIKTAILQKQNIRMDEHCFYVDVEYILYPVPYVMTVTRFDLTVYMYRVALATQSVSMTGFQTHINDHIRVIMNVSDYINAHKEKGLADEKIKYMETRIAQMVDMQVSIFLSFPKSDKKIQRKFKEFDEKLKEKNEEIYEKAAEYRAVLRLLRKTNFKYYRFLTWLSDVRNGK